MTIMADAIIAVPPMYAIHFSDSFPSAFPIFEAKKLYKQSLIKPIARYVRLSIMACGKNAVLLLINWGREEAKKMMFLGFKKTSKNPFLKASFS